MHLRGQAGKFMQSGTVEDYLKAIYELEEKAGVAKTTLLADRLGIKAGTVSEMIKRLSRARSPLIAYKPHHGVRLTPRGRIAALGVIRRHRLLETFLHHSLDLSWDEVHAEAEILEHHLSERVADAMDRHLGHPRFDPHGEPIPRKNGTIAERSERPLSDIEERADFRIVRVVPESGALLVHLESLGIGIGCRGSMASKAPSDGPVTIRIMAGGRAAEHVLERRIANLIYVEAIQSASPPSTPADD
jgi:DtxR family transcriptional regulator, Mn-dependent transcriptional regulator